ncbi:MAG: cytochrome-c peroxidase [Saprospiraceae bacterium]|nr:cytochrome-c peroxidase [Saprospiraceae bacterium]
MIKSSLIFGFVALMTLLSSVTEPKTKVQLGEKLFFDPILSRDSTISCASCHKPTLAFADSLAISPGVAGVLGRRNAPSVMNMASRGEFFYDGRAKSLRDQVHFPVEDPAEMDISFTNAVDRVRKNTTYNFLFRNIYGEEPNHINVADAISMFEESLETSDTEFDAWMADNPNQMGESAIRGRTVFMSERAKCFDCHFSPDFTGDEFRNIGLYDGKKYTDKGRFEITKKSEDLGKFKVPGLRNVAITGPYMHDGSFKSLEDVIEYYSNPYKFVVAPINMDSLMIHPIHFTQKEKEDLKAFLISLTDKRFLSGK